jgi:hypothetical protein
VLEKGLMDRQQLEAALRPEVLTHPRAAPAPMKRTAQEIT